MEAQRESQYTWPQAHMVINPIARAVVVMQPGHMGAYPDSDTGVPTASLLPHGRLLGGPCFTTAQAGMRFSRHTDAPFMTFHISVPRVMRISTPLATCVRVSGYKRLLRL